VRLSSSGPVSCSSRADWPCTAALRAAQPRRRGTDPLALPAGVVGDFAGRQTFSCWGCASARRFSPPVVPR
jgi:hypothetical protein